MRNPKKKFLYKWGRWMSRYRYFVLAIWLLILFGGIIYSQEIDGAFKDNGFTPYGTESDIGSTILQEELGSPKSSVNAVFKSEDQDLSLRENQDKLLNYLEPIRELPYVTDINPLSSKRLNKNKNVTSFVIDLNLTQNESLEKINELKKKVKAPTEFEVVITGHTALLNDFEEASIEGISKAELIGLPIALIILLFVFGTLVAAFLPLLVSLISITVTLGITYFIAANQDLSSFLPTIVAMLGMAMGLDYALFMISRFREELKSQSTVEEAVAMTCQTAGHSVIFSGIAVLIGLLGMLFINLNIFLSLSIGGAIVVAVSVLVCSTLLLSLFSILGERINSLKVMPKRWRKNRESHAWSSIAKFVMKRPIMHAVIIISALLFLMSPLADIIISEPGEEVLPSKYDSRRGYDLINSAYDKREVKPIYIAVQSDHKYWDNRTVNWVNNYIKKIEKNSEVQSVNSYLQVLNKSEYSFKKIEPILSQEKIRTKLEEQKLVNQNTAVIMVVPKSDPKGQETEALIKEIRSLKQDGLKTYVSGEAAINIDIVQRINEGLPYTITFIFIATFIILFYTFRSVVLPLKAVLMNILSLGASLGIVVAVVQKGYFSELFNISHMGYVSAVTPVVIFCIVFGISMDYEVFMISRIKEEYDRTGDNEHSTAIGLMKTGNIISSAALILMVVVGAFILTDVEIIKALGLGLAIAVLLDATIVRLFLVPSLMKLMGNLNWWAPRWLFKKERKNTIDKNRKII